MHPIALQNQVLKKANSSAPIAFFDLDHTLLPLDCHLLFINFLLRYCRTHSRLWPQILFYLFFIPASIAYSCRMITAKALKRNLLTLAHGLSAKQVENLCHDFVRHSIYPLLFPELLSAIRSHQKQGHTLILNSGSFNLYVAPLARLLDFHAWVATEVDLDIETPLPFLPKILGENNVGNAKIERMLNHPEISLWLRNAKRLGNNFTYTDHPNDLPLIALAKHITIVHRQKMPKKILYFYSQGEKKGWKFLYTKENSLMRVGKYGIFKQFFGTLSLHSSEKSKTALGEKTHATSKLSTKESTKNTEHSKT